MNDKIRTLILMAVNQCGRDSLENVLSLIEEQLTLDEAKNIRAFLKWAFFDWDNRMFGHSNITKRWKEWRATQPVRKVVEYKLGVSHSRNDNKPITLGDLYAFLTKIYADSTVDRKIFANLC